VARDTRNGIGAGAVRQVKSADQKDLTLSVSLKGLAAALDRLQALAGT